MKLRHVSATDAFGFQSGLDIAQVETEEAGEIVMSIEHSVSQTTIVEEFGNQIEVTYSAVLCCMDFQRGDRPSFGQGLTTGERDRLMEIASSRSEVSEQGHQDAEFIHKLLEQ